MLCPSCGAAVEEGADLCLECGEPMGDSPVARVVRGEDGTTSPIPKLDAFAIPVVASPRKKRVEEPEPMRCPGCGMPSLRERCPNCGTILRRSDD